MCNYEKIYLIKIRSVKIDSSDTEDGVIDHSTKTSTTKSTEKHTSMNTKENQIVLSNSAIRENLSSGPSASSTNCHERPLYSFTTNASTASRDVNPLSSAHVNHGSSPNSCGIAPGTISRDTQCNPPSQHHLLSTQNMVHSNENQRST